MHVPILQTYNLEHVFKDRLYVKIWYTSYTVDFGSIKNRQGSGCMNMGIASVLAFSIFLSSCAFADKLRISLLGKNTGDEFYKKSLSLALENTKDKYGDFEIVHEKSFNSSRAIQVMKEGKIINAVALLGAEQRFSEEYKLHYAQFPVMLGSWGYRVGFTTPRRRTILNNTKKISVMKDYIHGQASGWFDVGVLRANGFKVLEVGDEADHRNTIESIYQMLSHHRLDLFCRSIIEVLTEFKQYGHLDDVVLEQNMALHYEFPALFYTNSKSLAKRLTEGLVYSYLDGSYISLWKKHYKANIEYASLGDRQVYTLPKSQFSWLDFNYEQYFYKVK